LCYLRSCNKILCSVLLLFFLSPCATAFSIIDLVDFVHGSGGLDSIDDISYNPNTYTPTDTWSQDGRISAWVDIVGYTGMVKVQDEYYIGGSAIDDVVIVYDIKHNVNTGSGSDYSIKKFKPSIVDISIVDDEITILLKVDLKYVRTWQTLEGDPPTPKTNKKTYNKVAYFRDTESFIPETYPGVNTYSLVVYNYNNTVKPKAICEGNLSGLDIAIEYLYKGETVKYDKYELMLEYTHDKHFPYANLSRLDQWSYPPDNTVIHPFLDSVWMPGNEFEKEDFSVIVHTPYTTDFANIGIVEIEGFNNEVEWLNILWLVFITALVLMLVNLLYVYVIR
jgi:hypothetical protein